MLYKNNKNENEIKLLIKKTYYLIKTYLLKIC